MFFDVMRATLRASQSDWRSRAPALNRGVEAYIVESDGGSRGTREA
jgi:hypothetical protein